jgi:glycosyltransferase involved in cell wall biosynthesis
MRLPGVLAQVQPDALFAPGYTAPLRARCPVVLAVYDVSFCAHPEWFSWREGLRRRRLTRASARRARSVVTISEFSRAEIQKYLGVPADRVIIAAPGAPVAQFADGPRLPVVLYVGSLFNRRHIPDMIQGFAGVAASVPDARLVIVGDNRTTPRLDPREVASRLGVGDRVEWREYVADVELHALYLSARAFIFLSDYEGFGMTPLEALAHGVPSLLLDTEISREVYADSAVRVAADPRAIATGLTSLLVDGPTRAAALDAGRRRLGAFSWTRSADLIADALAQAAT